MSDHWLIERSRKQGMREPHWLDAEGWWSTDRHRAQKFPSAYHASRAIESIAIEEHCPVPLVGYVVRDVEAVA